MLSIQIQITDGQMLSDTLNLIISLQTHTHIRAHMQHATLKVAKIPL